MHYIVRTAVYFVQYNFKNQVLWLNLLMDFRGIVELFYL